MQEDETKEWLGSDQGCPACTLQAKLPNFHVACTFMLDKLKFSLTQSTTCIFLFVLEASGGFKNCSILVDVKMYICSIELT
jgi:hypothetical protein